ncbi:inhibitor of apoptosis repeat-containing protein [Setomelanomma holmii]|uniref:Inhibitor of apoptosis repeat-containing protein n=1 Tax=Setomelanomma holmii TaxID=210430 RepID=A0A9P4HPD5_9PLEO|nr:inhibitor of apoptosis repeat-containing protein [Setomelanomma holmii]
MDASMITYQARLATFQGAATSKLRRTSSRSKKAATKSKNAWPLKSPSAEDLAFAGFVWKPTSASPDNVQCFSCNCQLDGWEESDVPAYEHLTHSPTCGFAVVTAIRLRHGDPARTEEDPTCDSMVAARHATFGDQWPLDSTAGYPSVDQMVAAGWCYDPADDMPDGVTCPYCALALDAWDAGDDPMEEHRRRAADCLFFALTEMYHPPKPAAKKAKRATKSKRASTRLSVASTASTATKKSTRGKKRTSEAIDDTESAVAIQDASNASKRRRVSSMSSLPDDLPVGTPKKTPTQLDTEPSTMSSLPASLLVGTPKRTPPHSKDVDEDAMAWQPTDVEAFFGSQQDVHGLVNGIMIDAGLDDLTTAGTSPEDTRAALLKGLTDAEKEMTVQEWVLYNAKRGEEKLRMACEQQISAFEAEGKHALEMLHAIPTY